MAPCWMVSSSEIAVVYLFHSRWTVWCIPFVWMVCVLQVSIQSGSMVDWFPWISGRYVRVDSKKKKNGNPLFFAHGALRLTPPLYASMQSFPSVYVFLCGLRFSFQSYSTWSPLQNSGGASVKYLHNHID